MRSHLQRFQSTLPAWGATSDGRDGAHAGDFNPRSPRGERPGLSLRCPVISDFNPRSPRGERLRPVRITRLIAKFQSTLPAWGATFISTVPSTIVCYFNPRSPRGERLLLTPKKQGHSLFQSTLPAWGATADVLKRAILAIISIHAPRVGSDMYPSCCFLPFLLISIHAPRVGSDISFPSSCILATFQSTLPAWGATFLSPIELTKDLFQSTLPAWGATYTIVATL